MARSANGLTIVVNHIKSSRRAGGVGQLAKIDELGDPHGQWFEKFRLAVKLVKHYLPPCFRIESQEDSERSPVIGRATCKVGL